MIPRLEQLEDRTCPTSITYGGGPVIAHPLVASIHADPSMTSYTDQAMQTVLTQYLPLLSPYYGVGQGQQNGSINVSPLPGNPSQDQVEQFIVSEIQAGILPPPTDNQLYCYYLAPGQQLSDSWAGSAIAGEHAYYYYSNGKPIYLLEIYSEPPDQLSQIIAHEVAEAVTDPQPLSGWVDRSRGGSGEVADILMWQIPYQFTLNGFLFSSSAAPDGSPILPPANGQQPQPPLLQQAHDQQQAVIATLADLAAVAVEEFTALSYRVLALIDPRDFSGPAEAAQHRLDTNPVAHTPQGQLAVSLGQKAFLEALS